MSDEKTKLPITEERFERLLGCLKKYVRDMRNKKSLFTFFYLDGNLLNDEFKNILKIICKQELMRELDNLDDLCEDSINEACEKLKPELSELCMFPEDPDERFDEIFDMSGFGYHSETFYGPIHFYKPECDDIFYYSLCSALDGIYTKMESRFIAKLFRLGKFDRTEKERIDQFIKEICEYEQKLAELENSTESYVKIKTEIEKTLEEEQASVDALKTVVYDLSNK